jgi:hypothetical protein
VGQVLYIREAGLSAQLIAPISSQIFWYGYLG